MNFIQQTITIARGLEETLVPIEGTIGEGSGLGYYRDESGESYQLIHLDSGLHITHFGVRREAAMQTWLERVSSLVDWKLSQAELREAVEQRGGAAFYRTIEQLLEEVEPPREVEVLLSFTLTGKAAVRLTRHAWTSDDELYEQAEDEVGSWLDKLRATTRPDRLYDRERDYEREQITVVAKEEVSHA